MRRARATAKCCTTLTTYRNAHPNADRNLGTYSYLPSNRNRHPDAAAHRNRASHHRHAITDECATYSDT